MSTPVGPHPEATAALPEPGDVVDQFRIVSFLGGGATGAVYRATDLTLKRDVALKFLRFLDPDPLRAAQLGVRQRFQREAKVMARLAHPHIVQIHGAALEREPPYLVMEYLPGLTLRERHHRQPPLTGMQICRLLSQVVRALAYAWEQHRVIHRDLKPANLLLAEPESVKVADFGLAKAIGAAHSSTFASADSLLAGTPFYMAPEQELGGIDLDWRADLYAVGVILWELLTFRLPFQGANVMAIHEAKLRRPATPLEQLAPGVPPDLAALVGGLLEPDPRRRGLPHADVIAALDAAAAAYAGRAPAAAPTALPHGMRTVVLDGLPEEPGPTEVPGLPAAASPPAVPVSPNEETLVTAPPVALEPGTQVDGYRVLRCIGEGPHGIVYAAAVDGRETPVALKCFPSPDARTAHRWREAFGRLAPSLCALDCRAIARKHQYGSQGLLLYRVSDLYLGPDDAPLDLECYRQQFADESGRLDERVVRKCALLVLEALQHAHGRAVVHGNLKPANILFHYLGEADGCWRVHLLVTDFSLHALLDDPGRRAAGPWDSPEVREGDAPGPAADLYAVGAFLTYGLTGQHGLAPGQKLRDIRPELAPAWQPIVTKAMQSDPARRFASAEEMAEFVAAVTAP